MTTVPRSTFSDQPLQGAINGASWQFQVGHTDAFLSEGEDDFFAVMYGETYTPCEFPEPDSDYIIVSVPKTPGDYGMSLTLNMTFVWDNAGDTENYVATTGRIEVYEVTSTSVSGGLYAIFDNDSDFEVDGEFSLAVCPD